MMKIRSMRENRRAWVLSREEVWFMGRAYNTTHLFFFLTTGGSRAATIAWDVYARQQAKGLIVMSSDELTSSNTFFSPR